jgi:hypothetical protein
MVEKMQIGLPGNNCGGLSLPDHRVAHERACL